MEEPGLKFVLGKPLRGWLRKQGGMMRGWQRRFFVLQDSCLFSLNREDDTRVGHTYLLHDFHLKEVSSNTEDSEKFAFELVSEVGNGESIILCAATDEERREWMKALFYHIYAGRGGAIFGMPLDETMKYESKKGNKMPYIVKACVEHLSTYAMQTEGIFRLAGRAGLLKELRNKFDMGQRPALHDVDVHTVGSLLKAYLRELPESLVPPNLYQRAMNIAMRYAEADMEKIRTTEVMALAKLLEELPKVNYIILTYICHFLSRLAANADKTKMDARNLSLVFGPNLIRHMDNNPELLMLTADLTQHLAYMLIHHCDEVFAARPSQENVPCEPEAERPERRKKKREWDSVATEDLLRLSQPVDSADPSLLVPRPMALTDLLGIDLSLRQHEEDDSSLPSSPPSSPFVFVVDHFHADSISHSASVSTDGSTSSETNENLGCGNSGSARGLGPKPVPPARTRSRIVRNRRAADCPPSPMSPDSARQLDCQDILKALATSGMISENEGQSPEEKITVEGNTSEVEAHKCIEKNDNQSGLLNHEGQFGLAASICSSDIKDLNEQISSSSPSQSQHPLFIDGGNLGDAADAVNEKLTPSQRTLEAQIAAVKAELVNCKAKSSQLVSALKTQLTDMRLTYDARISSMDKQYQSQISSLMQKLNAERSACAEAVERTVSLQAQLYKYKMQYGEL